MKSECGRDYEARARDKDGEKSGKGCGIEK
jgi:hypothetical protein